MCRPACRIIHTGVRSVFSPLAARMRSGSLEGGVGLEGDAGASSVVE